MDIRISENQLTECWNRLKQLGNDLPWYITGLRVFKSKKKSDRWCICWGIDKTLFFRSEDCNQANYDFFTRVLKCVYGEN